MAVFSNRYARALADVLSSAHLDEASALARLENFSSTLRGSRDLHEVLANPSVTIEEKLRVLDAIVVKVGGREGIPRQVRNFLAVLIQNDRLGALDEILRDFSALADKRAGIQEAEISSARELSEGEKAELEARIAKLVGGRVRSQYTQDASLLGGATVRIGTTVYDGSLRGQLEKLKQVLSVE